MTNVDAVELRDLKWADVDRTLNPLGRFYRHNHMHADTIPMAFDEFGRCAKREWTSFRWELIYPTVTAGAET